MPAKKKLKWNDVDDIAFRLIDEHPDTNPMSLRPSEILRHITALPDFADDPKKSNDKIIESIQSTWFDERQDMEDDLGPLPEAKVSDDLDEDEYRDDKMIDELEVDEPSVLGDDDDDEEEEDDELGEGFQEEGID